MFGIATTRLERRWLFVIALALALPLASHPGWRLGLPISWQGDEPHYLVMITSLVNDGDLDLGNNYSAAHQGGRDAGWSMAAQPLLDHQTTWGIGAERIDWCQAYDCRFDHWDRDADGHPLPHPREDFHTDVSGLVERSIHPAGGPLLTAAFVWPFRNTRLVEPASVLVAYLAMLLAMLLFHALARDVGATPTKALAVTAAAFLATPVWHYSRSLFNEGFLLLFAVAAYLLVLRGRRFWLAGVLIGLGMLMKPPYGVVAIPLLVHVARQRRWRPVAELMAPCVAAALGVLAQNAYFFGAPWRSSQPFQVGNPLTGLPGMLFDPLHGLLPFAPLLLLAVLGWRTLLRERRPQAATLLGGIAIYVGLISIWAGWNGGWCYGPRLLIPVVPFCALGLVSLDDSRPWIRRATWLLGSVSVVINFVGAVKFWDIYDKHPLALIAHHFGLVGG
jgi:hypothetical protein